MVRRPDSSFAFLLTVAILFSDTTSNDSSSFSEALSPSCSSKERSLRYQRVSRHQKQHAISLSSSTGNDDYPKSGYSAIKSTTTSSDDRRNQSLEQGHHPLWSLNLNLDSMAQAGAGNRAQELLKRIHALYREGYYEVSPDIVSYNSVLKAWKEEEQPEAALELLETMIRNEQASENSLVGGSDSMDGIDKTIRVDVISFNTVIAAFANQGNYQKALELLRKMQKQPNKDGDLEPKDDYFYPDPDTITYNIVLYSLAQSKDLGTASQAENLLREMMMRKERTGLSVVDTMSFNTVLYAWSREGNKRQPTTTTTTTTPNATTESELPRKRPVSTKMAAQRAEDLLTIMEELSEAGNLNVRPDVYSYTTVIQSWAKCSGGKDASFGTDKAQAILNQMIAKGLQPNQVTYTALMNALSKGGQPEKAEVVLRQMIRDIGHHPDAVALSSVIDGWAKVSSKDRPEAAKRALQVFETMKQKASLGMGPTATTYTSVLNALAKSGTRDACIQALDLLQEMEEDYSAATPEDDQESSNNTSHSDPKHDKWSLRPTNIHYNCVLNAYARSSRADKAIKAQQLMTVMESHVRLDCRPDTISYNSLLMACAHATGNEQLREESFDIALRTFKILVSKGGGTTNGEKVLPQKSVHQLYPTSASFAHFFRAVRKLLRVDNPRRQSILTKSLFICRQLGLLNYLVVHQVQLACPSEAVWKEVAGELSEYISRKDDFKRRSKLVPNNWTCKARR